MVLEGFAVGKPVIASALPGLADLIVPGQTGWVVPPDDPEALAGALRQVFADRTMTRHMGQRAAEAARHFTWTAVAQRHVDLFEESPQATRPDADGRLSRCYDIYRQCLIASITFSTSMRRFSNRAKSVKMATPSTMPETHHTHV